MKNIAKKIQLPYLMSYSRLMMAACLILLAFLRPEQNPLMIILILSGVILTGMLDTFIARKFKLYSAKLRKLDSRSYIIFWICMIPLVLAAFPEFVKAHYIKILVLLGSEILVLSFGFIRYGKWNALHTYSSKAWAALLALTVINLCAGNEARIAFNVAFFWGIISQTESILIISKLKVFRADVNSIFAL